MEQIKNAFTILIVEDERITREVITLILTRQFPDFAIITAETGMSGLEMFKRHEPQLVITDIKMPGMDGIEMAAAIKDIKADTLFIAISAYDTSNYIERANRVGFREFLVKPVKFPELFAAIENALSERLPDI